MSIIINDDSNGVPVYTFTLDVTKANPYHDGATGRFTSGGAGGGAGATGSANAKKMNEHLDKAEKLGALDSDIKDIKLRHQAKDVSGLEDLETAFVETHSDYSRGGNGGMRGFGQTIETLEQLHTATVYALRDLTKTGKETWPTMQEMGGT